jgi:hypothetical protein
MGYRDYATIKGRIVDSSGHGDFTTIGAAIAALPAGEAIFICYGSTGTYTENLTIKNGNKFFAYNGSPKIIGKIIDNGASVAATFSNIILQTNGDNVIALTGSSSLVVLLGCEIICTNATGISVGASSTVQMQAATNGDLQTTGVSFWTGAGAITTNDCYFTNSGGSTTASSTSGSQIFDYTNFSSPIATSGSGTMSMHHSKIDCSTTNSIALTTAGTGSSIISHTKMISGTASAISVGSGTTLTASELVLSSSNTNVVTGSGTFKYQNISYSGTSTAINPTTQTILPASDFQKIVVQTFTSNGTYTPTAGMKYCIAEAVGGGGAGGGAATNTTGMISTGAGGGAGGYVRGLFTAAQIGTSQTVTIGAGGTGVSGAAGNNGGNTTLGALMTANGGTGGITTQVTAASAMVGGVAGGSGSGGSFVSTGGSGSGSASNNAGVTGGKGGNSYFGGGAASNASNGTAQVVNGNAASNYGGGGSGAGANALAGPGTGGNGSSGVIIVTEYI